MTSRANSMTAHWRPRHRPRYGSPVSRAQWAARTLPSIPRWPNPPGTRTPAAPASRSSDVVGRELLAVDPADLRVHAVRPGRVAQGLGHGQVGVRQLDVLADERDLERRLGRLDPLDERAPAVEVGLRLRVAQAELADEQPPEAERLELERDLVDRRRRWRPARPHRRPRRVNSAIFSRISSGHLAVGAQDDDVRLDADPAQLLHGVLGGLRLELARRGERRQQRHVHVQHVRAPDVLAHLADRLEERQALDVADGAADLDDHDVRVAVAARRAGSAP